MASIRGASSTSTPNNFPVGGRRKSSISLLSTRRRSLIPPRNYTFAPNVTPGTYPNESVSPISPDDTDVNDLKPGDDIAALAEASASTPAAPAAKKRRGGRKDSVDHIPRPPNAFMLFRQNFVHQRHVPGSIETSHASLSRIVGNCWKALPAKDKSVWEQLAEKAKQDHKRRYPDYRFQPKHDPEKKKKRQAAREVARAQAEKERREKDRDGTESGGGVGTASRNGTLELMPQSTPMGFPHQETRAITNFHLGHRRSSSVPLPSEAYNYHFGGFGQGGPSAPIDPYNFANPSMAQAPSGQISSGIALPSAGLTNFQPSWADAKQDLRNLQIPQSATMSRTVSPAGMASAGAFTPDSNMHFMGMPMGGMGPRASRMFQLGQLGRRASSTQPSLSHQINSGLFASNYDLNSFPGSFPPSSLNHHQQFTQFGVGESQQQHPCYGFDAPVAEGFTNPFAPSQSQASRSSPGSSGGVGGIWYDGVDPMTPVNAQTQISQQSQPSQLQTSYSQATHCSQPSQDAPPMSGVDSALIDPSFSFGSAPTENSHHVPTSPKPNVISASSSAPHTGTRDSFDLSAFNASLPGPSGGTITRQIGEEAQQLSYSSASAPHQNGFAIVQPVPIRKTIPAEMTMAVTDTAHTAYSEQQSQSYPAEHGIHFTESQYNNTTSAGYNTYNVSVEHAYGQQQHVQCGLPTTAGSVQTSDESASGGPSSVEGSPRYVYQGAEAVSSFELLDGPVDVSHGNAAPSSHQGQQYAPPPHQHHDQYAHEQQGYLQHDGQAQVNVQQQDGYSYNPSPYTYNPSTYGTAPSTQQYDGGVVDGTQEGPGARFSFSDYINGNAVNNFAPTGTVAN